MMALLLSLGAWAADPEAERISESIFAASRDRQWRAVERRYLQLVNDHPSGLNGAIHMMAAESAREEGRLLRVAQRLQHVRPDEEGGDTARQALERLQKETGLVYIGLSEKAKLIPEAVPFAPDLKAAIEHASAELEANGAFVGLLPVGTYSLGSMKVEVRPGFGIQSVGDL
jgi:hypothetical protein